jgi:nicotinamide-nucleotide amidase
MKLHLIFIGNKFVYNASLKEYVLRRIENESDFIDSITYFKSSDNSLFLYLEEQLNSKDRFIIITTKKNFSTIGKLISTVTSDQQIVRDGMLIPQKASLFEEKSYLLEHNNSAVNVIQVDEGETLPTILLQSRDTKATVHVFNEDKESLVSILNPIAQMYEVNFDVTQKIDGWLRVDIFSKRYGDISKFIHGAKNLLPKKLIPSSNVILYIIEKLSSQEKKISFAESCTGGLLSYYFTKENGASKILDGSLVTYSNSLKENWLAVPHETVVENGAVSYEVVREMSEGAMNVSSADFTLSISGIAGDGGGSVEKPVGTVYIGVRSKTAHKEEHLNFKGDRNYVQHQSALYAIKMLLLLDKETFF